MNLLYELIPNADNFKSRKHKASKKEIEEIYEMINNEISKYKTISIKEYCFYNVQLMEELNKKLFYLRLKGFTVKINKNIPMKLYINNFSNMYNLYVHSIFTKEDIDFLDKIIEDVIVNYKVNIDYAYFTKQYFLDREDAIQCKKDINYKSKGYLFHVVTSENINFANDLYNEFFETL